MQRWVVSPFPQHKHDGWTPNKAFLKACALTFLLAVCLSLLMCLLAAAAPFLVVDDFLQAWIQPESWTRVFPWGFGVSSIIGAVVGWLLLETMSRNAGMTGNLCTGLPVLMSMAVIASKHVLFAYQGLQLSDGYAIDWIWLTPTYLIWYSYGSWVGLSAYLGWRYFMRH